MGPFLGVRMPGPVLALLWRWSHGARLCLPEATSLFLSADCLLPTMLGADSSRSRVGLGCALVCGGCPRPPQSTLSTSSSSSCFLSLNLHPPQRKQASPTHPAARKGGPCGDTWTGAGLQKEPGEALGSPTPIKGRGCHRIECPDGE